MAVKLVVSTRKRHIDRFAWPDPALILVKPHREEFRMLCFNIGVDYDQLTPGGLNSQAIQMVRSCDHADKLEVLIAEVNRLRPSASL